MGSDGTPSVNLHDPSGVVRSAMAIRENGTPGLAMFDQEGILRASIDLSPDASAGINVLTPRASSARPWPSAPMAHPASVSSTVRAWSARDFELAGDTLASP